MINTTNNKRELFPETIRSALESQQKHSKALSISALNTIIQPKKIVTTNKKRPEIISKSHRIQEAKSANTYDMAVNFAGSNGNIYITFGGVGDLILLLAESYMDFNAKIIFMANSSSRAFGEEFLKYFKKNYIILPNMMGTGTANQIVNSLQKLNRLKTSAHIADGLDYEDWKRNTEKYKERLTLKTRWLQDIGTIKTLKKHVVICPSGSNRLEQKQRYLLPDEYLAIVHKYLKNDYIVYSTGSDKDVSSYPVINNPNHFWLMSNKTIEYKKSSRSHPFEMFLKFINSAEEIISMDTWLKTYSLLAGKHTKVIINRSRGKYIPVGLDPSDYIFLNTNFWPNLKLYTLDGLLNELP
jgi:hypothetical protein